MARAARQRAWYHGGCTGFQHLFSHGKLMKLARKENKRHIKSALASAKAGAVAHQAAALSRAEIEATAHDAASHDG